VLQRRSAADVSSGRRRVLTRSACLLVFLAAACSEAPGAERSDRASLQAGVDSAANRLLSALRTNGSDSLMALMADDVVLMPPNEAVLKGKAAVRAWCDQFLTQLRTSSLTTTDREVLIGGEWATEIAGFEWTLVPVAGGPATIERGSYVQVWHHEPDGRWLFARELWNSTAPPVTPSKGP
jgi:ketosteroid isomerase-like protein